jgi:hypothetical protein
VPVVSSGNSASRLLSEQSFSSWRRLQVGILYANYSISSSSSARGQQIHARLHTVIRAEGPNSFASVINDVASTRGYHLRVDGVTSPIVEVSWVDPPAATATNVSVFGTTGTGTMQQASVNVLVIGMCAGASMVIAVAFLAGLVMYVRRRTGCVHPQPAEEKETASSSSGEHELSPRRDKENAPSHALGQHQVQELVDDRRSTAEASPLRGLGRAPAESRRLAAPQLPSLPGFSPWSLDMCAEAACSQTPSQVPTQEFSLAFSPEAPPWWRRSGMRWQRGFPGQAGGADHFGNFKAGFALLLVGAAGTAPRKGGSEAAAQAPTTPTAAGHLGGLGGGDKDGDGAPRDLMQILECMRGSIDG